jgi:hypothetical protein
MRRSDRNLVLLIVAISMITFYLLGSSSERSDIFNQCIKYGYFEHEKIRVECSIKNKDY